MAFYLSLELGPFIRRNSLWLFCRYFSSLILSRWSSGNLCHLYWKVWGIKGICILLFFCETICSTILLFYCYKFSIHDCGTWHLPPCSFSVKWTCFSFAKLIYYLYIYIRSSLIYADLWYLYSLALSDERLSHGLLSYFLHFPSNWFLLLSHYLYPAN